MHHILSAASSQIHQSCSINKLTLIPKEVNSELEDAIVDVGRCGSLSKRMQLHQASCSAVDQAVIMNSSMRLHHAPAHTSVHLFVVVVS